MREKFALFQISPRRLLFLLLLLIQIIVALAAPYVDGSSTDFYLHITEEIEKQEKINRGSPLVKTYELISRCSQRRVQMMLEKKIDALGPEGSPFARLNFQSVSTGSGWIKIMGDVVQKYLCFSRNGRLINRTNGDNLQCQFKEVPHQNYIKLQSVANTKWFVGFNRRGHKLKGYAKKDRWKKEKCFMFLKINHIPEPRDRSHLEDFVNSAGNSIQRPHRGGR